MTYAVAVAVPLALLAFLVRTNFAPLVDLDERVLLAATDVTRHHDGLRSAAEAWELISQPWVVYALIGLPVVVLAWLRFGLRTRAMWAVATMATGWLLAAALKLVVGRARPAFDDPFAVHSGYSFPSGHATNNAIVVTIVILLLRPVLGSAARWALLGAGALWVLVTCADRVFLGAHFLSDVTAGVLLGCGLCIASYAGYTGWSPPATPSSEKESADDVPHQVA